MSLMAFDLYFTDSIVDYSYSLNNQASVYLAQSDSDYDNYYEVWGCTDEEALNYDPEAITDDGTCDLGNNFPEEEVYGCMDDEATNYDGTATFHDDSCIYTAAYLEAQRIQEEQWRAQRDAERKRLILEAVRTQDDPNNVDLCVNMSGRQFYIPDGLIRGLNGHCYSEQYEDFTNQRLESQEDEDIRNAFLLSRDVHGERREISFEQQDEIFDENVDESGFRNTYTNLFNSYGNSSSSSTSSSSTTNRNLTPDILQRDAVNDEFKGIVMSGLRDLTTGMTGREIVNSRSVQILLEILQLIEIGNRFTTS